jgi:hypothetical protein
MRRRHLCGVQFPRQTSGAANRISDATQLIDRDLRGSPWLASVTAALSGLTFGNDCTFAWGVGFHWHAGLGIDVHCVQRHGRASQSRRVSYVAFKARFAAPEGANGVGRHISADATLRIRLSDKTSRLRPRLVVAKPGQTYEPEVPVKVREWIGPAPASPDFVLEPQPPT